MTLIDDARMDKSFFEVTSLEAPDDQVAYWRSRPIAERLEALEILRQMVHGYDPATERLQRVLEIAQRPCR